MVVAQVLQLAATAAVLRAAAAPHLPLPEPWFELRPTGRALGAGAAAGVGALGAVALLALALGQLLGAGGGGGGGRGEVPGASSRGQLQLSCLPCFSGGRGNAFPCGANRMQHAVHCNRGAFLSRLR